jgi:NAD+ synthase (glutamine-hydrolysing)
MSTPDSLYARGFARVAVAVPRLHLSNPEANAAATIELAQQAHDAGVALVAFPELGLTGYANDDLFQQEALLDAVRTALRTIVEASADLRPMLFVGAPLRFDGKLFNTAVVVHRGRVLGVVPKSYLPNYREFYEKRQFVAGRDATFDTVRLDGDDVPFGTDLLFSATDVEHLRVHVEICEDVWVPIPPSTYAAMAGASVIVNLSASNITIGKHGYRRQLAESQSARLFTAYLYTASGFGESTTDLAWDGDGFVCENGRLLAEGERFLTHGQLVEADVDLVLLAEDRVRMTSYADCATDHRERLAFRTVETTLDVAAVPAPVAVLRRDIDRFPFVPSDPRTRDERCAEVYKIQVSGLATRLAATGMQKLVIGVSGGLDSTHALLVACQTMDELGLPRANVVAVTMPGFATTSGTRDNAHELMAALGVDAREVDIRPAAQQMLVDLGHPAADGAPHYDITYENVQAGARTSYLFRLANLVDGLVVGTGDLSELALGWCTYGVGDQMSHYNVNASVPKTLLQFLIRWVADRTDVQHVARDVLHRIVATEISPELVPGTGDEIGQRTEDIIGPYGLHDFFLYYTLRYGMRPSRVVYLAEHAWGDSARGRWPDLLSVQHHRAYDVDTIVRWMRVFLRRFFMTSQFKRTAMPNGPKVGSGGSLSPRGDWRAPSDSTAAPWLAELDAVYGTRGR